MSTFHEFIGSRLAEPAPVAAYRYLVVDSAATRPLNFSRSCGLAEDGIDILTGEVCVWRESASPVLLALPLAAAGPAVVRKSRETLSMWRYANCLVYLESPHLPHVLARMLRNRTEAVLPQNLHVLLRYFDPRVLFTLTTVLDRARMSAFFGIASRWAFPDRSGGLQTMETQTSQLGDTLETPVCFDTAQEAELIDAGEADAMIDLLLNQSNAALLTMLPPQQHERVHALLAQAQSLRINELSDQVAFCSLGLELGPNFFDASPWSESLAALKAGQLKFSQLLDRVAGSEIA